VLFLPLWQLFGRKRSVKSADSSALEVCKLIIIDYSPNKQKMSVGLLKGKNVFVANAACQKQRISFDQLCEPMAEDSTIGIGRHRRIFYRFRSILSQLCS
jgi:hypoxanthine phosphoribosyltransferase